MFIDAPVGIGAVPEVTVAAADCGLLGKKLCSDCNLKAPGGARRATCTSSKLIGAPLLSTFFCSAVVAAGVY